MTAPHSTQIGPLTLTTWSDGALDIPAAYFPNASIKAESVRFGANLWQATTGDRVVLIDAGSGMFLKERFAETGQVHDGLGAGGIDPQAVTDIIITHMHADHIGGLVKDGVSAYPQAGIHISADEWGFWTDPDLASKMPEDMAPMIALLQMIAGILADQVIPHDGEADLGDGLRLLPAPGHTPGHCVVEITGADETVLILGDAVVSGDLQFPNPDVTYQLDANPAQAVATRKALLARIADEGLRFAVTHLPHPGLGRLTRDGDGFVFTPAL